MKKLLWIGLAIVLVGAILYGNLKQQEPQSNGKRTVYALVPLTGSFSSIGKSVNEAIKAWENTHPEALFNIEVIDTETKADKAISALKQKTLSDNRPLVLSVTSMISYAIIPTLNNLEGFTFAIVTTEKENYPYKKWQQMANSSEDTVSPLIDLIKKKQYKTVSVTYSNEEFGRLTRNYFVSRIPKNIVVKDEIPLDLKTFDVRIEVEKLKSIDSDAVIVLGGPGLTYINILKGLKTIGYKGDVITGQPFSDPSVYKQIGNTVDGVYAECLCPQTITGCSGFSQELKTFFEKNDITPWYPVVQTFDTLNLIQYTLENNLPFTQETYTKMGVWNGIAGPVILKQNGLSSYPFILIQYKNGNLVPVE